MSDRPPAPLRVTVGPEWDGRRLDAAVGGLDAVGSRAEAQRLIEGGRVRVDGTVRAKRHTLAVGEMVEVEPQQAPLSALVPEAGVPFGVVFEDDHLIVVDKPAGVVVHPSAGHGAGTLVHGLLAHAVAGGDDPTRPGIVHRLDRDTSGLLVVAKSERAHRRLQRMMKKREIERRYLVLVHGQAPAARTVERPIGRDRRTRTRMSTHVREGEGREALTHLRRIEALADFSLMEARLDTGRTHQIRVHLEAEGLPVVGDPVYCRRPNPFGLGRQFLHAAHLAFPHPETGEPVDCSSPLPDDLAAVLDAARVRAAAAAELAPPTPWG
ncbi:MAG: RluA family pseudouridine synthase [Miltoncostaeaceae bacterium]